MLPAITYRWTDSMPAMLCMISMTMAHSLCPMCKQAATHLTVFLLMLVMVGRGLKAYGSCSSSARYSWPGGAKPPVAQLSTQSSAAHTSTQANSSQDVADQDLCTTTCHMDVGHGCGACDLLRTSRRAQHCLRCSTRRSAPLQCSPQTRRNWPASPYCAAALKPVFLLPLGGGTHSAHCRPPTHRRWATAAHCCGSSGGSCCSPAV